MTTSPTNHMEDLDREFQPETVLKELHESTTQYAGALLRLASLQGERNSRKYCRAFHVFEDCAKEYQWAQGMEELVMRN